MTTNSNVQIPAEANATAELKNAAPAPHAPAAHYSAAAAHDPAAPHGDAVKPATARKSAAKKANVKKFKDTDEEVADGKGASDSADEAAPSSSGSAASESTATASGGAGGGLGFQPALYVLGAAAAVGGGIAAFDGGSGSKHIDAPTLGLKSDTGSSASDFVTQDGTINVSAIAGTNSWEYSTNNGATWTAGTGTSFTLTEGSYAAGAVQVRQKDASGTTGDVGKIANAIVVDKTAAAAPVINAVAGDNVVNQAESQAPVSVSGTAEAGASVTVTWGTATKTVTAGTDGTWSTTFAVAELPAGGAYTITAKATDAAGNISAAGSRPVSVDTNNYISGSVFAGPTGAGIEVKAYGEDGTLLGTAVTDANGSYSIAFKGYTGLVLLSATDPTADSRGHLDEATGAQADITVSLRAVTDTGITGDVLVNLTPLTEIATRLMSPGLATSGTTNLTGVTGQQVSNANETVANLFTDSSSDLTGQTVNLVVNAAGADTSSTANLYGTQLAALQGWFRKNDYSMNDGINAIVEALAWSAPAQPVPVVRPDLTSIQAKFFSDIFTDGLAFVNQANPIFLPGPISVDDSAYQQIGIIDDGKGPTFDSGTAVSVSILETASAGAAVVSSRATDVAGKVSYTLAWGDNVSLMAAPDIADYFAINVDTGAITLVGALDHEAQASYVLTVTATDVWGNQSTQTVTVNVGNVNEAPVLDNPLADQIAFTNQSFSYTVPSDAFSDIDGDTLTYTAQLVDAQGNVSALPSWLTFNAQTGQLSAASVPQIDSALTIRVTASDGTLSVSDDFVLTGRSAPAISEVYTLTGSANQGTQLYFAVKLSEGVTVAGGSSGSLGLDLDGDGLADMTAIFDQNLTASTNDPTILIFTAQAPAGNAANVRAVSIDLSGALGVDSGQPLATNVVGQLVTYEGAPFFIDNTPPALTASTFTVNENATAVATLTATETVSWSLMQEGDFALFTINDVGELSFVGPRDYETQAHSYSVTVSMEDRAGNVSTQIVTVNLADVNEAPVLNGLLSDGFVSADQPFSYTIPNGMFGDPEGGRLTYTAQLVDGSGNLSALPSWLSIDAQTGALSSASAPSFAQPLTVRITASDGSQSVSDDLVLTSVNGATITAITADVSAAKEDTAVQFVVTFSEDVMYPNDPGTIVLTPDNGLTQFGLVFNSVATANLGLANKLVFSATMPAGDSANLQILSINLIDVMGTTSGTAVLTDTVGQVVMYGSNPFVIDNTAPTLGVTAYNIAENATAVATLSASETVTWSLAPSGDGALFNLSADGQLSFKNAPDYETSPQSYTLDVSMTDVVGNVTNQQITVYVTNVNEAPIVNLPLPDRVVVADQPFSYTFALNAFTDVDVQALTYTAQLVDGSGNLSALPSWLTFDSATRTFSSNAAAQFATPLTVRVTASDGSLSVSDDLVLTSVTAPSITAIASGVSVAKQGAAVQFTVTLSEVVTFDNGDAGTITLTTDGGTTQIVATFDANATLALGQADKFVFSATMPAGNSSNVQILSIDMPNVTSTTSGASVLEDVTGQVVTFGSNPFVVDNTAPTLGVTTYSVAENATAVATLSASEAATWSLFGGGDSALFSLSSSGVLSLVGARDYETHAHSYNFSVNMTDAAGNTTTQAITVNLTNVNEAPVLANALQDQTTIQGQAFSYLVPANSFSDVDAGTTLTYTAQLAGGGALPGWLTFNAATHTFSSASAPALGSPITVRVTASDGSLSVSDDFQISQQAVPTFSTNLNGVTNLDVRSDLVFTASENIELTTVDGTYTIELVNDANSGSKTGYSGSLGESTDNTQTLEVTVISGMASATLNNVAVDIGDVLSISGNKLIIDPVYDLDFSNNYHIEIDAGLFVGATSGLGNAALTSGATFATVTPNTTGSGAALVSGGAASQIMNADGTLSASYKWVGVDGIGNTFAANPTSIGSLAAAGYALVATDQDSSSDIATWDFWFQATGFTADDLIYLDTQHLGETIWDTGENLALSSTDNANETRIEFSAYAGSNGPQSWMDIDIGGEWRDSQAAILTYFGTSQPVFVGG